MTTQEAMQAFSDLFMNQVMLPLFFMMLVILALTILSTFIKIKLKKRKKKD